MSQTGGSVCTLQAADAYIEGSSLVAVTRPSQAHSYTLHYRFGALEGYLDAQGAHSDGAYLLHGSGVHFSIPESFYAQIPTEKEGLCELTCQSYLENAPVGQAQTVTFRIMADPQLCAPSLQAAVRDINEATLAATGDENILVRYASTAQCQAQAQAQKSASLVSVQVNGVELENGQATFENVETDTFTFIATDSRGFSAEVTVRSGFVSYTQLSARASSVSIDPSIGKVQIMVTGQYFYGSFGGASNAVSAQVDVYGEPVALEVTEESGYFRATAMVTGLDYSRSHFLTVTVSDRVKELQCEVYVPSAEPVFDWGQTDFAFHVPVTAPSFNETNVQTLFRGFCLDANALTMTGTYRIIPESQNVPVPGGILVNFFCGDLVLQLASNETGSEKYLRMMQSGTDHDWMMI